MKVQEVKDRLAACGWVEDRFGHMKKDLMCTPRATAENPDPVGEMVPHRIKFQKISLRFEREISYEATLYNPRQKAWFAKACVYLKDIKLDDTGALAIGNYRFKPSI